MISKCGQCQNFSPKDKPMGDCSSLGIRVDGESQLCSIEKSRRQVIDNILATAN